LPLGVSEDIAAAFPPAVLSWKLQRYLTVYCIDPWPPEAVHLFTACHFTARSGLGKCIQAENRHGQIFPYFHGQLPLPVPLSAGSFDKADLGRF
jgi:hypothetical protein